MLLLVVIIVLAECAAFKYRNIDVDVFLIFRRLSLIAELALTLWLTVEMYKITKNIGAFTIYTLAYFLVRLSITIWITRDHNVMRGTDRYVCFMIESVHFFTIFFASVFLVNISMYVFERKSRKIKKYKNNG